MELKVFLIRKFILNNVRFINQVFMMMMRKSMMESKMQSLRLIFSGFYCLCY